MRLRVRRVVPGCWESLCPCCVDDPVTGPVVAQVGSWERAMRRASEHLAAVHRVLSAADREPPVGTLVVDSCGGEWVNDGHRPSCWSHPRDVGEAETWTKIAGNYGPVTVLEWGDDDG